MMKNQVELIKEESFFLGVFKWFGRVKKKKNSIKREKKKVETVLVFRWVLVHFNTIFAANDW